MKNTSIRGSRAMLAMLMLFLSALAAPPVTSGPVLGSLNTAQVTAAALNQAPVPAVSATWPHAQDLNTASQQFMAWQAAIFKERTEVARSQPR